MLNQILHQPKNIPVILMRRARAQGRELDCQLVCRFDGCCIIHSPDWKHYIWWLVGWECGNCHGPQFAYARYNGAHLMNANTIRGDCVRYVCFVPAADSAENSPIIWCGALAAQWWYRPTDRLPTLLLIQTQIEATQPPWQYECERLLLWQCLCGKLLPLTESRMYPGERFINREIMRTSVFKYSECDDNRWRRHCACGGLSPEQFENQNLA